MPRLRACMRSVVRQADITSTTNKSARFSSVSTPPRTRIIVITSPNYPVQYSRMRVWVNCGCRFAWFTQNHACNRSEAQRPREHGEGITDAQFSQLQNVLSLALIVTLTHVVVIVVVIVIIHIFTLVRSKPYSAQHATHCARCCCCCLSRRGQIIRANIIVLTLN